MREADNAGICHLTRLYMLLVNYLPVYPYISKLNSGTLSYERAFKIERCTKCYKADHQNHYTRTLPLFEKPYFKALEFILNLKNLVQNYFSFEIPSK